MAEVEYSAAVAFNPNTRKYSIVTDIELVPTLYKGSFVDVEGSQLTVVEMCESMEEAETVCSSRSSDLHNAHLEYTGEVPLFCCKEEPHDDHEMGCDQTPESSMEANGFAPTEDEFSHEEEEAMDNLEEMLQNMMDEFADDVVRINMRYTQIKKFLVRFFGTGPDGSITNSYDNHDRRFMLPPNNPRSLFAKRPREDRCSPSYIDKIVEEARRSYEREVEEAEAAAQKKAAGTRRSNRVQPQPQQQATNTTAKGLSYSFITRAEEERILRGCGNVASTYAQRLAKVVFADSLHLYFKDQEPRRREWLHEAVDYRFPSEDKNTNMLKWKNCSNAINKNMRDTQKEKRQESVKASRELNYTYVSRELEEECLDRAGKDPIKYGELLAFYVFIDQQDKFFKEHDPVKKDWIRACVDRRFHVNDKEKAAHRWKIVAAACNRNRYKVVGPDGKEDMFPYFSQDIEEECFEQCGDVPAVYAELMNKHLFPDTPHLMFKDQDIGRRNWLHDVLDRRFPTPDKFDHIAKWKTCTAAMNKNKTESAVQTPVAPPVRKEVAKVKRQSEVAADGYRSSEEPEAKRPRRTITVTSKLAEAKATDSSAENSPVLKRRSVHNKKETTLPPKTEPYSRYPFVTQNEELDIYDNCNNNAQIYAKMMGKQLFAESLHLYYKDQDPDRRVWMREIVDFRFPTANAADQKQKWKNVCAAINKNMPSK